MIASDSIARTVPRTGLLLGITNLIMSLLYVGYNKSDFFSHANQWLYMAYDDPIPTTFIAVKSIAYFWPLWLRGLCYDTLKELVFNTPAIREGIYNIVELLRTSATAILQRGVVGGDLSVVIGHLINATYSLLKEYLRHALKLITYLFRGITQTSYLATGIDFRKGSTYVSLIDPVFKRVFNNDCQLIQDVGPSFATTVTSSIRKLLTNKVVQLFGSLCMMIFAEPLGIDSDGYRLMLLSSARYDQ